MSAYIIVGLTIKDAEKFKHYGSQVPATLSPYSGEVIAKGPVHQLHGDFDYDIQVIIKFPTVTHAQNWYNSDAYQGLVLNRDNAINSQFQLIG